ncbi:hypothetical protein EDD16DRAFT_1617787, partial [Pisolithus croceorrhizus]
INLMSYAAVGCLLPFLLRRAVPHRHLNAVLSFGTYISKSGMPKSVPFCCCPLAFPWIPTCPLSGSSSGFLVLSK